jgi:A118 family predicted phage portal protein
MDTIRQYLKNIGYNTVSDSYYSYITMWDSWYKGYFADFHSYRQYNGTQFVNKKLYSLGMAKKVCEDHAALLLNEKVGISTGSDSFDKQLDDILKANNFRVRGNQLLELTFALGTGAFVEYKDAEGNPIIDYVRAQMIYPLSWDNGDITECAFASQRMIDGDEYYYINTHTIGDDGNYIVKNEMVKADDAATTRTLDGVEPQILTGSPLPRFQIIMPNIVNNIDYDCPMGISVFANAIDQLKAIDVAYDSYVNEFQLGKKRIMVPMSMVQTVLDGADSVYKPVFDPNDVTFYAMNDDALDTIHEINMELRAEPHEAGLQRFLSLLGDKCGLGAERYKFEKGAPATATQVISEKSDMYQNVKKNELVLESALVNMVDVLAEMGGVDPDSLEVKIDFDDSIIEDKDSERTRMLVLVNAGKYPLAKYLVNYENYTQDEADEVAAYAESNGPTIESGFGSNGGV